MGKGINIMIENKDLPAMPLSKEMSDRFTEGDFNYGYGFTKYERTVIELLKGLLSAGDVDSYSKDYSINLAISYADRLFEKLDERQ